jgi:hypothetical protein
LWRHWLLELLPLSQEMEHSAAVAAICEALGETGATWGEWLAALALDPERLHALEPDSRDRMVRGAVRAFLAHWRGGQPAALLVDEVAAVDTLSLELLAEATREGATLLALAGRHTPDIPQLPMRTLRLAPLAPEALRSWIEGALPGRVISDLLLEQVVERSGGSPL